MHFLRKPILPHNNIHPGLEVIKLFSSSTQLSTKFQLLIKTKILTKKKFVALSLSDVVFIMLINVKMPTIVGILTFMSRINFVLSWVEHGKSFITSGLDQSAPMIKSNLKCSWIYAADLKSRQHLQDKSIYWQDMSFKKYMYSSHFLTKPSHSDAWTITQQNYIFC